MKIMQIGGHLVTVGVFKEISSKDKFGAVERNLIDSIEQWNTIQCISIGKITRTQNFDSFLRNSKVPNSIRLLESLKSRIFKEKCITLDEELLKKYSEIDLTTDLKLKQNLEQKIGEILRQREKEYLDSNKKFKESTIAEILIEARKLGWPELRNMRNFGKNCENLLREIATVVKIKL